MGSSSGVDALLSVKQRRVLDAIDKLRNCGLDHELSLPQIVVCGDQSAGKSSVLEALTEINFPRADEVCTRFATEIILRRDVNEALTVRIIPDKNRPGEVQDEIKAFRHSIADFAQLTSQLAALIEKAKQVMGICDASGAATSTTFARDVLSIEITGPNRPQFTVVDLPGMIQNENMAGDRALVEELTEFYISQPRTLCLAVIAASYDADNQRVLTLVKKADPNGTRSLGIITKPDVPPKDSGSQNSFIALANNKNKKYFFRLGWHVLRNRAFAENDASFEDRNNKEADFFRNSNFKQVPRGSVGVEALRQRLSDLLFEHVVRELPGLRSDVERMLHASQKELATLGSSRATAEECRDYLIVVSDRLRELGKSALDGNYEGAFFASNDVGPFNSSSQLAVRRLRALLQHMYKSFAEDMRKYGHTFHIGAEPDQDNGPDRVDITDSDMEVLKTDSETPLEISHHVALAWVESAISRNRGRELLGNYNPLVIGDLFHTQSRRWKLLTDRFVEDVAKTCSEYLYDALSESCAPDVRDRVWTQLIDEALKVRETQASDALEKIMRSYEDHPINYNHYYTDTVQKIRQQREMAHLNRALQTTSVTHKYLNEQRDGYVERPAIDPLKMRTAMRRTEADMERFSCAEVLDCTRAIYKVKQKVFVDNVLCLVVEEHIVRDLEHVFAPRMVSKMEDEVVEGLAMEPEITRRSRLHLRDQIDRLREGDRLLRSIMGGFSSSDRRPVSN